MKNIIASFIFIALAAGCYASAGKQNDAASDLASDPGPDPGVDPIGDPPYDVPDIVPDIPFDGPDVCSPPSGVQADFLIAGSHCPGLTEYFERWCVVDAASGEEGHTTLEFICPDEGGGETHISIEIISNPPILLFPWAGMEVVFRFAVEMPFVCSTWFTIHYSDGPLFAAGVDADSLTPPGFEPHVWYSPLVVRAVDNLCPLEYMDCYDYERFALDVTYEGTTSRIFDGQMGFVGFMESYQIAIETASGYRNIRCPNMPGGWYKALFVLVPEG